MIIIEYALPIAAVLLLVIFFAGLPSLKRCVLPSSPEGEDVGRSRRLSRGEYLFIFLLTAVYAVTAFTNLGDAAAPETFVSMKGNSAVIRLQTDAAPSRIMLYTGIGSGSYDIEYSADGVDYTTALSFEQGHAEVLKWQELTPETELRPAYVRVVCTSGEPYLGELALIDGDGQTIPVVCDAPALADEQSAVPAHMTYMNSSYFDEIYHARTAWENLNGIWPYEISHPPLGKEIIAVGISLFGMTPFGWRFMGALFGALMLPLMYVLLKRLFGGKAVPALGTLVFASDFMHYTQTRIATVDTYAVFFILLMYLFMYEFYSRGSRKALALSGVFFGLGAASKWTCIYAGAGLAVLWALYWVGEFRAARPRPAPDALSGGAELPEAETPPARVFPAFAKNSLFCLLFFVLIPCLIYYLSYLPYGAAKGVGLLSRDYLRLVLDNQEFMFSYHSNVVATHPYSSRWYQWILDIRPILYYLQYFDDGTRSSICAFLNPALCWGGFLSLFVLGYAALFRRDRKAVFILVGYLAQLLPWVFIKRLTFEYHYFACSVFLVMAVAYVFELLRLNRRDWARYAVAFAAGSVALFILFYPALGGLSIDNELGSTLLGWLPTWPL